MSEKRKMILQKGSASRALLFSVPCSMLLFMIIMALCSVVISKSNIAIENLKYMIYIAMPFTSFFCAVICSCLNKELKGLIIGILASFCFVFVTMLVIILINSAQVSSAFIICCLLSVLIGLPAGILGANMK